MCSTQDVRFAEGMIDEGRSFTNKLWNASRLVLLGADPEARRGADRCRADRPLDPDAAERGDAARDRAVRDLPVLEPRQGAVRLRLERRLRLVPRGSQDPALRRRRGAKRQASETALFVLERVLALLHPVMPFVTEEIWPYLPGRARPADAVGVPGRRRRRGRRGGARRVGGDRARDRAAAHAPGRRPRAARAARAGRLRRRRRGAPARADATSLAGLGRATIVDDTGGRRAGRGRRRPRAGRRRGARRRAPRQARAPPRRSARRSVEGAGEARRTRGSSTARRRPWWPRSASARSGSAARSRPSRRAWPSWRGRWPGSRTSSRPAPRSACGSGSAHAAAARRRSASRSGRSAPSTSSAPTARPRRRCSPPRSSRRTVSSPARTSRRTCTGSRERVQVGGAPLGATVLAAAVARVEAAAAEVDATSDEPLTQFEVLTAAAFVGARRGRRRGGRGRGRPGRPLRRHQRARRAGRRAHQRRPRPHGAARRHARGDRGREAGGGGARCRPGRGLGRRGDRAS